MATTSWASEPVIAADGTVYAIDSGRGLVALTPGGTLKWATALPGTLPSNPGGCCLPTTLAIGVDGSVFATAGEFDRIKPNGVSASSYDPLCDFAGVQPRADGSADWFGWDCDLSGTVGMLTAPGMGPDAGVFFWNSDMKMHVSRPSYGPGDQLYFVASSDIGAWPGRNLFALVGDWKQGWSWAWSVSTEPYDMFDSSDSFDSNFAWPIVRDDGSVVFADSNGLHAVSPGGAPLWNLASEQLYAPGLYGTGALASGPDGTVYSGSSTTGLVVVSPSGTTVMQLGGMTQADRPIVDGRGTIYVGAAGGIVAIASDGTELWQTSAAATPLAIDAMGTLYALDATMTVLSALR